MKCYIGKKYAKQRMRHNKKKPFFYLSNTFYGRDPKFYSVWYVLT